VTTQAQVLGRVQKPKQPPSQLICQLCSQFLSYALFCLRKYSVMPYQAQMKGDAMQGSFVQESKKTKHLADAVLLKGNAINLYILYS